MHDLFKMHDELFHGLACLIRNTHGEGNYWQTPEGDVVVDDRDELEAAYASGELTKKQYDAAIAESEEILREMCEDIPKSDAWCAKVRQLVENRIATSEPIKPCKEAKEFRITE